MTIQDILIAALLHDVGKPMQRGELEKLKDTIGFAPQKQFRTSHLHVEWTSTFFQEFCPELETAWKLAASHHKTIAFSPEDERWAAEIIKIADQVVSGHDRTSEKSSEDYKSKLLTPVFSTIENQQKDNICLPLIQQSKFINDLMTKDKFYNETTKNKKVTEYKELTIGFINAFQEIYSSYKTNNNKFFLINSLDHILEEFFWCVPANTQEKYPVSSLYHHSKLTAMIAAVLYQYYVEENKEEIFKLTPEDNETKFFLIAGDLNGIQNYIFDLNEEKTAKTAKLLRARSFKVKIICDIVVHRILDKFNLVKQNVMMNVGGRFIILAPNIEEKKAKLANIKKEIENELFRISNGALSININSSIKASLSDFSNKLDGKDGKFHNLISKVFSEMAINKKQKYKTFLSTKNKWKTENFIINDKLYSDNLCEVCKRRISSEFATCHNCLKEIELGKQLQHKTYGIIGSKLKKPLLSMFNDEIQFALYSNIELKNCSNPENEYFKIKNISQLLPLKANASSLPVWRDDYRYRTIKDEENDTDFLTFDTISKLALIPDEDNKIKGVPYLAVLKGDVDNLGWIFSDGIKQNYNLTVWSTLSSQVDLFFSRLIPELIESKFSEIYTVFTGGDDFVLVGPWNRVLEFTEYIYEKFSTFVNNHLIHFSAGISLCHGKDPIRYAIDVAENKLEISKEKGKNRITLFDTTVNWSDFQKQMVLSKKYDKWYNENVLSMQTFYKLFEFNKMYLDYEEGKDPNNLMYLSRMHYDLNRNVYNNKKITPELKEEMKEHEKELSKKGSEVMKNLKIALTKTIYNNRRGGKNV